jgi:hypothetical protein
MIDILTQLEMRTRAGYRENYAMDNGKVSVVYHGNHKCYEFTYSSDNEYQDANGALYDTVTKSWRG